MLPEEKARLNIDKQLTACGYVIQDMKEFNPMCSLGVAVRSYPTDSGNTDYVIFIDGKPIGVIEAKEEKYGEKLSTVAEQSARYANSKLKWVVNGESLRFAYESTGIVTNFTDYNDRKYSSRRVFAFHQPKELQRLIKRSLLAEDTLRNSLKALPSLNEQGYRKCQVIAIKNLEQSFAQNKPRALIQMATGAGKTFTAISFVYRLLKFAKAKRILFLVDTRNLGRQANEEFASYKPNDDSRLFTELYNVQQLKSNYIADSTHVCISTIQRMYSILCGKEVDDNIEEDQSMFEVKESALGKPKEVVYNNKYPIEYFDFIIIDECHRSIYNIWQQVLDYFDSFLIGLTATPDKRTLGFFNENIVSEYTREKAILDGVNVGEAEWIIETSITGKGAYIAKQNIEHRERMTRKQRWEMLDEDLTYTPTQLDRDIVNPSQIRSIIKAFKDGLPVMFENRTEVPKTLIFAKTDSHAEDIIKIIKEEFGEGNEFCKKITYQADKPEELISNFRNAYYPRIAVTVDMIATGTDVRPIECLLFMRDVRSRNYFEQMKGRGTRICSYDEMAKVNKDARDAKDGFVIVDAVGVLKSVKTDSRSLDTKPSVSLKDLMMSVALGNHDEGIITTLAGRLTKLDKVLTEKERKAFVSICGKKPSEVTGRLLNCFDDDFIYDQTKQILQAEPTSETLLATQSVQLKMSTEPFFDAKLREFITNARKAHDQIIDTVNLDIVTQSGWATSATERAKGMIATFRKFLEDNKSEITALSIIYSRTYTERPLTIELIQQLYDKMLAAGLQKESLWDSYVDTKRSTKNPILQLADVVSIVRYELGIDNILQPFEKRIDFNFMKWTMSKNAGNIHFSKEQMDWLRMVKDHIAVSMSLSENDLEYTPFDSQGGLKKFYNLFGVNYKNLIAEINAALAA